MKERNKRPPPRPKPAGAPRRAPGSYAPPRGRPRSASPSSAPRDATGTRTGPRARAAQQRTFDNPYQRAQRPSRDAAPRERMSAPGAIRLDPDVARVFRDAESVNEALRLVMRLARFGGGRAASPPREYTPRSGPSSRSDQPTRPPRERRDADVGDAPETAGPRFEDD